MDQGQGEKLKVKASSVKVALLFTLNDKELRQL